MWIELFEIWKSFWAWLTCLSKQGIAVVCVSGATIASMGFAIFMLLRIDRHADNSEVKTQLSDMRTEFLIRDSISRAEWSQHITLILDKVAGVDTKVTKVILLVSANSESDLVRRITPYLENLATKQDISFILDIQKDETRTRKRDTHTPSIKAEKVNRFTDSFKKAHAEFDSIYLKK